MGGPFLRRYLLAEHARCPHAASMLESTRTTFMDRLVRFLAWNMPYHVEHHAYPSVPFHKLPEFHEFTRKHVRHQKDGYLNFNHDYLRDSFIGKLADDT
ncbi:fatty acid desaturase [Octadecabacter ascidiaceicola]|uniref:fatty acid desaturase n=1 Tax=Octadecabacter ascidiaceicola TaxID=1655543 RepID=UPI000B8AEF1B|nr:fatty acid desaturase [Octadecabacter ascidiaceicola]